MPSSDRITPVPMRRVALVAPQPTLRALLVRVAAAGVVEVETPARTGGAARSGHPRPAAAGCGWGGGGRWRSRSPTCTGSRRAAAPTSSPARRRWST